MKNQSKYDRQQNPILLPRARNFSEPPRNYESEGRSKNHYLPPMDLNSYSLNPQTFDEDKPLVNLKTVLLIEEKLSETLEKLRLSTVDKQICDDYWSLTEDSSIPYLERLFTEKRTQIAIRHACIIELAAVAFANICFYDNLSQEMFQQFRNLFYYIHQNYLTMMKLVLHRCSLDSLNNAWTNVLKSKVSEKLVKIGNKGGVSGLMKHHSALACKILENISTICPVQFKSALMNILKCLFCTSYFKARHLVESTLLGLSSLVDVPEEAPILPSAPYLPSSTMPFTLILDLDETLVHYVENGSESHLNVRPGCSEFLVEMAKYYEIVIFTAALQDYADWAIDIIDLQKSISYRLYRQHTMPTGSVFVKDLSRIGRDLSKVIIVDNVAENFRLQSANGIFMKSWFEDMNDQCLQETGILLKDIANCKVPDVRVSLRNYRDQVLRQIIKGVSNPSFKLFA